MRGLSVLAVLGALIAAGLFWATGTERSVLAWALEGQRAAQAGMAAALRGLRAGDPEAVMPLLGVAFGYGLFHAIGPGHGKLLIGAYGAARAVGALRLSTVALAASLAQGASAVALVAVGLWGLGLARAEMTGLTERLLQPAGFAAMAAIGLSLAWRGLRGLHRLRSGDDADCGRHCRHGHAPAPAAIAAAASRRDMALLVAAVAIRPCTGALLLLILTAQLGIFGWGVAGTLAMALGTASVTVGAAVAAVALREGVMAGFAGGPAGLARMHMAAEVAIGLALGWLAGGLALAAMSPVPPVGLVTRTAAD